MTCRELLEKTNPNFISHYCFGGARGCPDSYNYMPKPEWCWTSACIGTYTISEKEDICNRCWDREIPEEKEKNNMNDFWDEMREETQCTPSDSTNKPRILDSGNRTKFETGAVRDIQEGKGRCDLMPLDVVAEYTHDIICHELDMFVCSGDVNCLYRCLSHFEVHWDDGKTREIDAIEKQRIYTMLLEVAKHFEEGCKKYGENNWKKGIPVKRYIDSAIRHYLKFQRGDKDEPHDRAFCWNIMCAIWTCKHKPELNDYAPVEGVIN